MRAEVCDARPPSDEIARLIRSVLRPLWAELATCSSTAELQRHPAFLRHESDFRRALNTVLTGNFAPPHPAAQARYRIVAWNIERGKQLAAQIHALRHHPYLRDADVLLVTEADLGMARSGNVDVARLLAEALGFDYAFAPCYLSLVKGSGLERDVDGDNDLGLHGNAILSRYPICGPRLVPLENGIDKMAGPEKRLGSQSALLASIAFPGFSLPVACVHLDAQSSQRHRAEQMRDVLAAMPATGPALIGGDWNTTTFNSSSAFRAIMGYWLRVFMGPGNVIRNHYLRPDRWFERRLFSLLRRHGYDYSRANVPSGHTIFYDVTDIRAHRGLAEWVPGWCFPFIRWALREHNGGCPLKIDWFATRDLDCHQPHIIHKLRDSHGRPLSDHDPIGVDIAPPEE